jgi:tetratricopeptide (TPR) repeat protein
MRRIAPLLACLAIAVGSAVAQDSTFAEYQTTHYRVLSELGDEHARQTAEKLEAYLELFNDYFHFELDELPVRMRARFYASKDSFDGYIERFLDEQRDDFVYLHYSDLARSELVGYELQGEAFDLSLKHQGFIQFLRAFVPNPPLWLREGFAVYFEQIEYDESLGLATYRENLSWLETLQSIIDGSAGVTAVPFSEILNMTVDEAREQIEVFYPQAWGMVSFLLNSPNRDYNRILWDSISALDPAATLQENSTRVYRQAFQWVQEPILIDAFVSYTVERRSFRALVQDGIELYQTDEKAAAEEAFVTALQLREDNPVPYYYMGLINYDRQDFNLADFYYKEALERGSEEAITYYALGVNAFADNRFEDATSYLEETIALDPENYEQKANQLLERIGG